PKNKMFFDRERHGFHVRSNFITEVLLKVFVEDPGIVRDAVKKAAINMLKPVNAKEWLTRMQTHKRLYIDIRISPFNVGEGMVVNIVLHFPEVDVATKNVKKISGK